MYTFRSRLLALLAIAVLAVSCAGKPPVKTPETGPQPTTPAVQPTTPTAPAISQAELDALLSKAQGLKKHAFDLGTFEVLPDAYKAADAAYADAKGSYDAADKPAAKDKLEKAIALFNDVIAKGVVELASARRDQADSLRAAALKAGAETSAADRLGPAKAAYDSGAASVAAGKHEEAIATFERARLLYELAWKRATALELQAKVADKGYAPFDSGNASIADAKLQDEARFFGEAGGLEAAALVTTDPSRFASGVDALDEAILRYNLVVQKARTEIAARQKAKTDDAKDKSEGIKANVAAKEAYAAALADYQAGTKALAANDYEEATSRFEAAAAGFENAYTIAADKRAKALEAMEAAAAAAEESRKKAQEADTVVAPAGEAPAAPSENAPAEGGSASPAAPAGEEPKTDAVSAPSAAWN